jgi:hypothetical protein
MWQVLILTEAFTVDLGSCLPCEVSRPFFSDLQPMYSSKNILKLLLYLKNTLGLNVVVFYACELLQLFPR